jgi:hypothetical protein
VADQVRLLQLVEHLEREQLRVLLLHEERLIALQIELQDLALLELRPGADSMNQLRQLFTDLIFKISYFSFKLF